MPRTDRLFRLMQILRRGKIVRAEDIARELEVSVRTVYRDIATLKGERLPIDGEAGIGYRLGSGFELPPLMFTEDELDALTIGARIVQSWADPALGRAAEDLLVKIAAVVPKDYRNRLDGLSFIAPPSNARPELRVDPARWRMAIRERLKVDIDYSDVAGAITSRTIWPMCLAFFPPNWLALSYCELRKDFRSFRMDRITAARIGDERFPQSAERAFAAFLKKERERRGVCPRDECNRPESRSAPDRPDDGKQIVARE
ncbi:MAG: YafY family protein [Geminicoccaceae bacterium]